MNKLINTPILLSLIVPVVKPELFLEKLFISLSNLKHEQIELVLINQSGKEIDILRKILNIELVEYVRNSVIPAAEARNLGASLASGEYLFFLDDDAFIYSNIISLEELIISLSNGPNLLVPQRGEVIDGCYISHWPQNTSKITYRNFSRFIIEWNLIIKKELFLQLGGFNDMGPGSHHACQCGEAFVLTSKIIVTGQSIKLCPNIKVAHPGLFEKAKNTKNALGYAYATGFAIGIGLNYFNFIAKIYWINRGIFSAFYELLRHSKNQIKLIENVNLFIYRLAILKCKILGLIDAVTKSKPRSLIWLDAEAKKIIN
jgi:glycosyltransferase involved in cell wall biosynthesis